MGEGINNLLPLPEEDLFILPASAAAGTLNSNRPPSLNPSDSTGPGAAEGGPRPRAPAQHGQVFHAHEADRLVACTERTVWDSVPSGSPSEPRCSSFFRLEQRALSIWAAATKYCRLVACEQ